MATAELNQMQSEQAEQLPDAEGQALEADTNQPLVEQTGAAQTDEQAGADKPRRRSRRGRRGKRSTDANATPGNEELQNATSDGESSETAETAVHVQTAQTTDPSPATMAEPNVEPVQAAEPQQPSAATPTPTPMVAEPAAQSAEQAVTTTPAPVAASEPQATAQPVVTESAPAVAAEPTPEPASEPTSEPTSVATPPASVQSGNGADHNDHNDGQDTPAQPSAVTVSHSDAIRVSASVADKATLNAIVSSVGLQWIESDPARVQVVQTEVAAQAPVKLGREPKVMAPPATAQLTQVETRTEG